MSVVGEAPRTAFVNLQPVWAGEFQTFNDWVNRATMALAGRTGSVGEPLPAMCVDALGRRCNNGRDFMKARDEGTFPVRYFWQMEPAS